MKAVLPILLIGIIVAAAAVYYLDPLTDRNAEYRAGNERVSAMLKHPEGGELVQSAQESYTDGVSSVLNRAKGWRLIETYRAPSGASADDISAFYEANAPSGWKVESATVTSVDTAGNPGPAHRDIFYSDGRVRVTIATDGLIAGGPGTYVVTIDHQAGPTDSSAQR